MTETYKPAPRYLGKKLTAPLSVNMSNEAILKEGPALVAWGIEQGLIHPPSKKPLTDRQIANLRQKDARAKSRVQADQS
jgi:hypothetical protein